MVFVDKTDVRCLQLMTDNLASIAPPASRAAVTQELSNAILAQLPVTFISEEGTFPFIVGDVATNAAAEYRMLRQLMTISTAWHALATAPTFELAEAMLAAVDTYRVTVQANVASTKLVLPPGSQMYVLQENVDNFVLAATQVRHVRHAATGNIPANALAFDDKRWILLHKDKVRVMAAIHHMKHSAQLLKESETVDRDLLATAVEWANMIPAKMRKTLDEHRVISEYYAAAQQTNMQLAASTVAAECVKTWG